MEQDYELSLSDIKKVILGHVQLSELYIPLQGKYTTKPDDDSFDLAGKVHSFFEFNNESVNDPKVMLLMGDTGSGKSVFSQHLYQQLWKRYSNKTGDPIPLWIPLPELQNPFERAVEEVLTKYGFNDSQISEMKGEEKFIFIVDGYDELHQFQNCYVTNKWHQWNAKVLITCRSQALYYQKDPDKYFMPFNGEKRLPQLLRRLYVASFSQEQIRSYITKYQQLNIEHKISEEDFTKVPGLNELIKTPFLLHLAVEALPDILANQVDNEKMTQAKLYDVFMERWFTRQVEKLSAVGLLKETEKNTKQQFWDYCKGLAQQMHAKEVSMIPYLGPKVGGRLFGKQEQTDIWESFFNEETKVVRSACPLKRFGDHYYGFMHSSMIDYFATRAMYEEIQENESNTHNPVIASEVRQSSEMISLSGSLRFACDEGGVSLLQKHYPKGGIHQRVFACEPRCIQFLADRIEMSEAFKQKMLAILGASKSNENYSVGAANAITALVKAGVSFNGANLSGINISGADISGGYFDQADLSNANLSNIQISQTWLRKANLKYSKLEGMNFGEYPWFKGKNCVNSFDYREDLQKIATDDDNEIVLWNTVNGEQLNILRGHGWKVTSVKFSNDGNWLVSGSWDGTVRIWDVKNGGELALLDGHGRIECIAISQDGGLIAAGGEGEGYIIRVWKVASRKLIARLEGYHSGPILSVQFSPDGEQLVSGSQDTSVIIWSVTTGRAISLLLGHKYPKNSVCFSANGKLVAAGCDPLGVQIWAVRPVLERNAEMKKVKLNNDQDEVVSGLPYLLTGRNSEVTRETPIVDLSYAEVNCIAFSPNGECLAAGAGNAILIWNVASAKVIAQMWGHENKVTSVQFSTDGQRVVSGSHDTTVRMWKIHSEQYSTQILGHLFRVDILEFSMDMKRVISSSGHDLKIWHPKNGLEQATIPYSDVASILSLSPDGKRMITVHNNYKRLEVWDLENNKLLKVLQGHKKSVASVSFSPDGKYVVTGDGEQYSERDEEQAVRIWDISNGQELQVFNGHEACVNSVAFSSDGNLVVSGSKDKTVRIWDVVDGKIQRVLKGGEVVTIVRFSQANKWVDSISKFKEVRRIWSVEDGKELEVLEGNKIKNVYSRSGEIIVTCEDDNSITVRNLKIKGELVRLQGHKGKVHKMRFNNNETRVLSCSEDSTFRIWNIADSKCLNILQLGIGPSNFLYDDEEVLILGFDDGSLQWWLNKGDEINYSWQLFRSTDINCRYLNVHSSEVTPVIDLREQNRWMLEQRGALVSLKIESEFLPSSEGLIQIVGMRTGSPLHQKPEKMADYVESLEEEQHNENQVDSDNADEKSECCQCAIL